jgi:hypothetical protein
MLLHVPFGWHLCTCFHTYTHAAYTVHTNTRTHKRALQNPEQPPLAIDEVLHRVPCVCPPDVEEEEEEEGEGKRAEEQAQGSLDPLSSTQRSRPSSPNQAPQDKHVSCVVYAIPCVLVCVCVCVCVCVFASSCVHKRVCTYVQLETQMHARSYTSQSGASPCLPTSLGSLLMCVWWHSAQAGYGYVERLGC